ncbi:MAG: hypothetical protein CMP91_10065 [Gammaproteobacteria bacterium]|nr:hypothetical protein [Gammaproteobacteria bacterium]MAY03775.1 hypothetical protein [Gammaproteobacteria bacterium]|tara:strand:+ start:9555 stop:10022 length:468 start_codon:yes stop_codon:yes gene_type:complete
MKRAILIAVAVFGSILSINSFAQNRSAEEQAVVDTETRQAVFKLLAFNMAPLQGMARGGDYNAEVAIGALENIEVLASMIVPTFGADTSGFNVETRALDRIWGDMGGFEQAAMDLVDGANAAIETLNSEGAGGVRSAIQQVGPMCGACHDAYRAE